ALTGRATPRLTLICYAIRGPCEAQPRPDRPPIRPVGRRLPREPGDRGVMHGRGATGSARAHARRYSSLHTARAERDKNWCGLLQTRGEKGTHLVSEADLEKANRRVADTLRRIADLKAHIEQRRRDGRDASDAIELLAIFEASLDVMIDFRDQLAKIL